MVKTMVSRRFSLKPWLNQLFLFSLGAEDWFSVSGRLHPARRADCGDDSWPSKPDLEMGQYGTHKPYFLCIIYIYIYTYTYTYIMYNYNYSIYIMSLIVYLYIIYTVIYEFKCDYICICIIMYIQSQVINQLCQLSNDLSIGWPVFVQSRSMMSLGVVATFESCHPNTFRPLQMITDLCCMSCVQVMMQATIRR